MENQVIVIDSIPDWAIEFTQKPNGIKKALEYNRTDRLKTQILHNTNVKIEDGVIYFSDLPYRIAKRPNNVYHLAKSKKGMRGFTVNKRGTLQVWWNQDFNTAFGTRILITIADVLNVTWFTEATYLHAFLSKGNFGKILQGKIKNPGELAEQIVKSHKLDVNPALFLKLTKIMNCVSSNLYDSPDKHKIIRLLRHSINADAFIEKLVDYHAKEKARYEKVMISKFDKDPDTGVRYTFSNTFYNPEYEQSNSYVHFGPFFSRSFRDDKPETDWRLINDVLDQLELLGHKINLLWSYKRLTEEHNKWSAELLSYEIDDMEDEKASPYRFSEFFKGFEDEYTSIVDTTKKAFTEGKVMKHCFYTSYWSKVKNGRYLTYHTTYGGIDGTLSIIETFNVSNPVMFTALEAGLDSRGTSQPFIPFKIDQFYGKSNKNMPEEIVDYYKRKLAKVNADFVNKLRIEGSVNVLYDPDKVVVEDDTIRLW
jgi:hypothetical protein